jgi:hypothetical protein
MTVLVVGDRSWIEASLKTLPFVKSIGVLDTEGNPIPARTADTPAPANSLSHAAAH